MLPLAFVMKSRKVIAVKCNYILSRKEYKMETAVTNVTKKPLKVRIKQNYNLNKPKYLQGAGYVGIGLTAASSVYAGYKMPKAIAKAKKEIKKEDSKLKRFWKYFKHTAPVCAPALITAAGTVIAFKEADKEKNRRFAVVAAAYSSTLAELNTLKSKVEEVGGKKVAEKVKKAMVDEEVGKVEDPESKEKLEAQRNADPQAQTFNGVKTAYYDPMLKKVIWTTRDKLVDIQCKMLAYLEANDEVDMSIFYDELGINKPLPEFCYDYGWRAYTVQEREFLRAHMPNAFFDVNGTTSETHDGVPCMYIEYFNKKLLVPF